MSNQFFPLSILSLALLLGGCALGASGVKPTSSGVDLTVSMTAGQQVQAMKADIASAAVSVLVGGVRKDASVHAPSNGNWFFDLSQLPEGEAEIQVEVFDTANKRIGKGEAFSLLQIGRRNHVAVRIMLTSEGRTDYQPVTPFEENVTPMNWAKYVPVPKLGQQWSYSTRSWRADGAAYGTYHLTVTGIDGQSVNAEQWMFGMNGEQITRSITYPLDAPPLSQIGSGADYVLLGYEVVYTPQGYSNAAKIGVLGPDETQWSTVWLVEGIGRVREEHVTLDPLTQQETKTSYELMSMNTGGAP